MTVRAHIDDIETMEMNEQNGTVVSVVRKAIVSGLTEDSYATMLDALEAAGIPVYNDRLDVDTKLRLRGRKVRMIEKSIAEVTLDYGLFCDSGQSLTNMEDDPSFVVVGKMSCSVQQVTTNQYRENGKGDLQTILVSHTYPEDDPDYAGQTLTQSGEISTYVPQRTYTIEGILANDNPWSALSALIGCVNDRVWLSGDPYTWMCMEVSTEMREYGAAGSEYGWHGGNSKHFVTLNFQHNPDTWNTSAVFIDDRTNRPPQGLVEGVGYKPIMHATAINFLQQLGFYLEGGVYSV